MKQTFTTARTLASGIEIVGWALVALALVGTAFALNRTSLPSGAPTMALVAAGAVTAATGFGLVLAAQLVQAQVATAINTSQILEHVTRLSPQTEQPQAPTSASTTRLTPITPRQEPYAAKPHAEGRFLRMVKGYELHKYSDGISVNGEGRYATIVEAEKRAAELAANEHNH